MFTHRSRRFWAIVIVIATLIVLYLPSLIAYRFTAASQNTGFLTRPWQSWSFLYTALTVPADAQLKTSGQALRRADRLFAGSAVDAREVRLLFLSAGKPYTFTHDVAGRSVTSTVTPPYRFTWQVSGVIDPTHSHTLVPVALLDYRSGRVLYDVRADLPPGLGITEPTAAPSASP
jgi:hypothetical protein